MENVSLIFLELHFEMMAYNGSPSLLWIVVLYIMFKVLWNIYLQSVGIVVIFLPPYSPDLNPIEEMFSFIKYYLRQHDDVIQAFNGNPIELIKGALT